MSANLENPAVATGLPNSKEGQCQRSTNYHRVVLTSHASKAMLNNMWTENFHIYKLDLEKAEEPKIKLPTFIGAWKKKNNSK